MFEAGEVLMSEDIDSLSVTSFSFNWSIELEKYDVMPWIVGLFRTWRYLHIYNLFIFDKFFNSFLDEVKIGIGWMIFQNKLL